MLSVSLPLPAAGGDTIDRCRRRKNYVANVGLQRVLEERAARAGIIAIVFERVGNGLGHDGVGREMHDGVDREALEQGLEAATVAGMTDDEFTMEYRALKPGREIIQDDDVLAGLAQLSDDVTADVTRTPGDENCFMGHRVTKVE